MNAPNYFQTISYLVLEANSSCNLACAYCNRQKLESEGLREPKNLTLAELDQIAGKFKNCAIDTIKFEYLSEPMLHPQFHLLAERLRSHFPRAFTIIATNLQYALPKTSFLKTLPFVDMIYLSIDGVGEIYEKARAGAKFDKLIRSLEDIQAAVDEKTRKTKLHINFTLSPQNYRTLPQVYELQKKYGLASVRINLAQNWNEEELNQLQFGEEIVRFLEPYRHDVKGVGGWDYKDCYWPFNGIVLDVFGDIRQCIINTSMKPIGNIFKDDIEKIYNTSLEFAEARRSLGENKAAKACRNCDYKHLSPILSRILRAQTPPPRRKVLP